MQAAQTLGEFVARHRERPFGLRCDPSKRSAQQTTITDPGLLSMKRSAGLENIGDIEPSEIGEAKASQALSRVESRKVIEVAVERLARDLGEAPLLQGVHAGLKLHPQNVEL